MKIEMSIYRKNIYSQWGEDGIIEKIFSELGITNGTCLEFGAWDGFKYSNTAALWTKGWSGFLIEGDPDKYKLLKSNIADYACKALCYYVGHGPHDSLEFIMNKENIPLNIDLLSIDIDGDELHILKSFKQINAKVLIVEYNPTFPFHLDIRSAPGSYMGCSGQALVNAANELDYFLIATTDTNCIFIKNEFKQYFEKYCTDLRILSNYKYCTYIVTTYSGKYQVIGNPPYGLVEPDKSNKILLTEDVKKIQLDLK